MNTTEIARSVLSQIPARIDDGGCVNPGATAYYLDVPKGAIPSFCTTTATPNGCFIEGSVEDCTFSGFALFCEGDDVMRRVLLMFSKRIEPVPFH